jgi:hypothetical protein
MILHEGSRRKPVQRGQFTIEGKTVNHEGREASRKALLVGFPLCDFVSLVVKAVESIHH